MGLVKWHLQRGKSKTSPADTDTLVLLDTGLKNTIKRFSWSSIKSAIATYLGFEADLTYTMSGSATVWKDIMFPMAPPKTTGAGNPSLVTFHGNFRGYAFAINDTHDFDPQEFQHDGKQGSTAYCHLHWISRTNVGAIRTIKWRCELSQTNFGAAFPVATVHEVEISIPANTPANTHFATDLSTFTTLNIASMMLCKITRIASSGTEPADDPVILGMHYHYELDTIGSREIFTK